jgi:hypothetical protein
MFVLHRRFLLFLPRILKNKSGDEKYFYARFFFLSLSSYTRSVRSSTPTEEIDTEKNFFFAPFRSFSCVDGVGDTNTLAGRF